MTYVICTKMLIIAQQAATQINRYFALLIICYNKLILDFI
jgi:hypothetical protein